MKRIFCLLCLLMQTLIAYSEEQDDNIENGFIPTSNGKIEYFLLKPEGEGPFPVLFLFHGWQPLQQSIGGKQLVYDLKNIAQEGIVGVSISAPGFGNSDGRRDFSGPDSQKAVMDVIEHFRQASYVDASKVGLYGISQGATLASMISSQCPNLMLQILESGRYNLVTCREEVPSYLSNISLNILNEAGDSLDALIERSATFHTEKINAKTLILHGQFDDRKGLTSAQDLHEKLLLRGIESQLIVYPQATHILTSEKWDTIIPFLRMHFFDLYGIGIKVGRSMPAIQVQKIHRGFAADLSGKLKVGDVILRVSPNDDENVIDVLRMPMREFIDLIIGKKGSTIRLYIQHFDQSYETITLVRQ